MQTRTIRSRYSCQSIVQFLLSAERVVRKRPRLRSLGQVWGLGYKNQVESLYDFWERDWTFYEMIIDYYEKHPDPNVQIIKMPEMEKGEQGGEGSVGSNSDGN